MKTALRHLAAALLWLSAVPALRAAEPLKLNASVDFSSAYLWRGERVCGLHVHPDLAASWGRFTLENYGFLALDGTYKEIDWDLSVKMGDFTVHAGDFFFRTGGEMQPEDFFCRKKGKTTHVLEGALCYLPEGLPFTVKWFTFFYGFWLPEDGGTLGRNSFSSWLELEAYHRFQNGGRLSLVCGSSILKGPYTSFKRDFAVCQLDLRYARTIPLGKVDLPCSITWMLNPYLKQCFLAASVGVAF